MTQEKCQSCNADYAQEATYYGHPIDKDGNVIPALDNWPLCEMHAIPHAIIAGWKPTKIQEKN